MPRFSTRRTRAASGEKLAGALLISLPAMPDLRFSRSVICICSHTAEGTMGIVVNKQLKDITMRGLLGQMNLTLDISVPDGTVFQGGPVEQGRGFVLHSTEWSTGDTQHIDDAIAITTTTDILQAIASGKGPQKTLIALGYAGWDAGQLEKEIDGGGWLIIPRDENVIFAPSPESKWESALATLGIDIAKLASGIGNA